MSSHSSHSSGSFSSFFTTAQSWLASAPIAKRNPLSATDAIGHELTDATVKTTTGYVANILNPLCTALTNAVSILDKSEYKHHGWQTLPRGILGALTNTGKSVANIFTGIPHALNHAVQHGVNNTTIEATNGTLNRIPLIGKFLGNIPKLTSGAINAPTHFLSWLTKKGPDQLVDWINKIGLHQAPERHLTGTTHAHAGGHDHH